MKRQITENNALLAQALETAANGVIITDENGTIVWTNSAIERLTGYKSFELIGENPRILKSGIHDDSFYTEVWGQIKDGSVWHGEMVNRKKDGSFYFEEQTITPIKDSLNNITNYIAIKQDVTDKRFATNQLVQNEASLQIIVNNLPAVIWLVDTNMMFVSCFGSGLKTLGLQTNELVGNTIYDYFDSQDDDFDPIKAHIAAQRGISVKGEFNWEGYIFQCYIEPYYDSEGNILGCVGIGYDITQRKAHEEQLEIAKSQAEKSEKMKSEFLSQMSHEIRTPLNVIINFLDLLEEDLRSSIDDDLIEGLSMMKASSNRITRTINLLLNMSEMQSGSYEYNEEVFDLLEDIVIPCYKEYEVEARLKGLDFRIAKDSDFTIIESDKYSVNEIIRNLVDNAIKYTNSGSVKLILSLTKDSILFSVSDTGIGISDEYKEKLFDIFTQEDQGYTRRYEGNGLGLALVKNYCAMNNIKIELNSEKDRGSTFNLYFKKNDSIQNHHIDISNL